MSDKNPISAIDFAKKIKAKYPDYSEVPDIELAQKMVAKYPEYKDIVVFEAEKKSHVQSVSKAGTPPSAPGFEPFQPPVAVETPSVLTPGGQQQYKEQRAKQTQGIQSALNAYKTVQGENIAPATVEPAPTIRPETQRTGNYAKHLYNKFLEGTGSLANAVTDAAFAAGEFLPTGDPYVESGKLLKDYRQNNASKVRSFLKDQIGAEVDKGLQRKYDEGLVSGAVAGLAGSIPAMVGASATGGGTLFAQMYDAGLQSIEAQPGAKNLPEDVKTIYAGTVGLVTSALEKYGLDRVLKGNGFVNSIVNKIFKSAEGKKLTGDVLENLIDENVKGVAKIFAKGGVRAVDAFTTEFGTGTSQEIATDVSERLLDKATGEPIFDTSNKENWEGFLRRIARAGVQEGIGGGIMGGGIGMLTAGSKKAVRENQQIINGIDEQLANPELSPEVQEVLLQRKADVQTKVDDLIEQEAETQSKLNSDDLLEAQDLSKQVDKIDTALAQPDIPEPVKADLEEQKQNIEQEIDKVIKRRPKKEVAVEPKPINYKGKSIEDVKIGDVYYENVGGVIRKLERLPNIKDSKGIEVYQSRDLDTGEIVTNLNNETIRFEEPDYSAPTPAPTPAPAPAPAAPAEKIKVSGTVLESPEALSDFEFATVKLPNGKFAVYETWSGAPISNQYDTEAEVIEAFNVNKGNLTAEAVQTKIDQNAVQNTSGRDLNEYGLPKNPIPVTKKIASDVNTKITEVFPKNGVIDFTGKNGTTYSIELNEGAKGAVSTKDFLSREDQDKISFSIKDNSNPLSPYVGSFSFWHDGNNEWHANNVFILNDKNKRQGVASEIYRIVEKIVGKINPSNQQTEQGKAFWEKRKDATKINQNAVQKQTADALSVQPAPETGAKVAQGVSEPRLGKPTEESKGVEATPEAGLEEAPRISKIEGANDNLNATTRELIGQLNDYGDQVIGWVEKEGRKISGVTDSGNAKIENLGNGVEIEFYNPQTKITRKYFIAGDASKIIPFVEDFVRRKQAQGGVAPAPAPSSTSPLVKAETDLESLKSSASKAVKYKASMNRLIEAKKAKQITESEFNQMKQRFDDVMAESKSDKVGEPRVEALKEGFTESKDLNRIFAASKEKYGEKEGGKYNDVVFRLVDPNKNTVVEVRSNGVVVKEGGKYLLKPFTNTDANYKKWELARPLDVTDQYAGQVKPDKIAEAKSKLAEAKAALDKLKTKAGIASDPKEEAKALYNYHKALVGVAKAYIEVGIKNIKDFAKELGEDISEAIRKAWDEANGGKVLTPEDFDTLPPPMDETLVSDAEVMGITKKQLKQLQTDMGIPEFVPEKNISRAESRAKADRVIERGGFNIADLIAKMKDPNFVPSPFESDLLRSYFISLTSRINSAPTAELISERNELIKLIREAGYRGGAFVQSIDGLIAVEDNLASFLTEQSEFADLSKAEIAELTEKYNKAQEAIKRLEEMAQKALDKELEKRAKKVINETPRPKVKADFKAERAQIKQDMRAALRKARGLTQATFVPYMNELVAIAPYVRKMVTSYVNEGIYDLKEIVKGIREDLVEDIPDITETDVRDIIAGKYPNPKNTKNYKLAMVRDLETQARLEDKVEKLEAGILETKSPVQKRVRSKEIEDLEAKIKQIKQRYPELTYPTRLEGRKSFYNNKIKQLKAEIAKGDFDPVMPTPPIVLDREALVLKDEYAKFKHEMQERRRKQEYEALSKWQKNLKKARGLADIRRAVMISVDLSIPFRQGVAVMLNPRTAKKGIAAYGEMLSAVKSRKNYDRMMVDLERSPAYLESKDDGIVYNEVGAKISTDEWHQQNPIIDRIPILRDLVKGSEVAAAAWTNYARFELYLKGTKALLAQGKTRENSKQAYEDMAARVMVDTGRGKIPLLKDKAATDTDGRIKQVLSNTLFGPRLYSAIFRKLNPLYYFNPKVDRTVRIEALKDMAGYVSSQILLGLAVAAAGGVVSLDPDDPDFLKARWGKKVIDLTGGQAPYVRTFLRLVRAALMKYDPDISETDAEKYASFATQSTLNFWRNKLAPNTAYVADWFAGSNSIGEDFDPWGIIKVYPMYTEDIVTALKEGSPLDAAIIAPIGVLGLGYQEYTKDVRRARLSTYVQDPAVKSFLKKNKLTVTGDINQEVYDLEAGVNTKMTKEQSDKYEKVWGTEVEAGIKANMEELQKLADKDKANEDKEGYKKKLPSAIGRIKAEATMEAKKQITGVSPQELTIEDGGKKYILSAEQIRKRVKLNQQYIERNQSDYIRDTQDYMKDGLSKELAQRKAMSDLRSAANKESKYVLLDDPDFKNKAIVE